MKKNNFMYFFLAVLVLAAACGLLSSCAQASHRGGFSCCGAQALRHMDTVVVAHRLSCSSAWGIFPDQGSNLCLLHW